MSKRETESRRVRGERIVKFLPGNHYPGVMWWAPMSFSEARDGLRNIRD